MQRIKTELSALGFQSTLPTRGSDILIAGGSNFPVSFQSTLPTRGSDNTSMRRSLSASRFQSTLPTRGSDDSQSSFLFTPGNFNPRSPRGGATPAREVSLSNMIFQSTLPTRGSDARLRGISADKQISIHAPHEGERRRLPDLHHHKERFQSTLPTRGSDAAVRTKATAAANFNPRSPRGGATHHTLRHGPPQQHFNPRSPRGGATTSSAGPSGSRGFQSTLPTRGSDCCRRCLRRSGSISIHAPHEGERHRHRGDHQRRQPFQSTLPTRGSD